MRNATTVVVVVLTFTAVNARSDAHAQIPTDTGTVLARAAALVHSIGVRWGEQLWPAFRPDTVPLLFVVPSGGAYLFHWPDALPAEFSPVAGLPSAAIRSRRDASAASTGIELGGRPVAQIVVTSLEQSYLVPTAVHEAFHAFEGAMKRPGTRFGRGEQSTLVSSYPVFDVANEAAFALEGRLLAAALRATSLDQRRTLAQQFSAVREARHRRLTSQLAEFESMAELHEGMAQYVYMRALMILTSDSSMAIREGATRQLRVEEAQLERLTADVSRSVRLRFYLTGPAMARVLDGIAPRWKETLLANDLTVDEMLAQASGFHAREAERRAAAERRYGGDSLTSLAARGVERLKALRRRQVDSLLSRPGIQLVVSAAAMSGGSFGLCGFDPQNLFRASPTVQVHMRWVRPCNTSKTFGEFNTPVVQDDSAATMTAVIGREEDVALTAAGQPVRLADGERLTNALDVKVTAAAAAYQAARANLSRTGRVLRMDLLP